MCSSLFHQKLTLERVQQNLAQLCAVIRCMPESASPLCKPAHDISITLIERIGRDLIFMEEFLRDVAPEGEMLDQE